MIEFHVPQTMAQTAAHEARLAAIRRDKARYAWTVQDQEFLEEQLDWALRARP